MIKRALVAILVLAGLSAALAAAFLVDWAPEHARREAFIYRCNEEGEGGMFTSRDYCEELYRAREANKASKPR